MFIQQSEIYQLKIHIYRKLSSNKRQITSCKRLNNIQKIKQYCINNWPEKSALPIEILPYYQYRHEISYAQNLLLKDSRIIIPPLMQREVLDFIHSGHQGIVKCRERAKMSVWWIGLSTQIERLVRTCPNCVEERLELFAYYTKFINDEELIQLKSFNTKYVVVTESTVLENVYDQLADIIKNKSDEFQEKDSGFAFRFQEKDSGFAFSKVSHLEIHLNSFKPIEGSSYIKLPPNI
ncbi:Integrase zinc binding domain [Popillia japonica]|uniref:RNA-directed DNA polymerase n=1 Tax=Popillia japonica TaxID=7064 RepID=A0AAW1LX32_POPJA